MRAAVDRAGVDPAAIDDVYLGCANQAGEDNRDVARMAVLLAGLPQSVPGVTLNRLCASGLAGGRIGVPRGVAGDGDLFVAGGVESMTRAPLSMPKPAKAFERGHRTVYDTTLGWRYPNPRLEAMFPLESMGETGENVAEQWHVSREDQDAFALRSQQQLGRGAGGRPVRRRADRAGRARPRRASRGPTRRPRSSATLKAAFRKGGSVTAGNSSGMNDGAAALVIASEERAARAGRHAACGLPRQRGCRRGSADDGHRPDPRGAEAARPHGRGGRRHRPGGAERGVRVAERRGGARAGHRSRARERRTAGRSRSATRWG